MKEYIEGVGEVEVPKSFKDKAANFWYHYKWHSIIALILVFAIIICSLQFCKKEEYDIHILYAGPYVIGKTASDGNEAEVVKVISSLERVAKDFDSDNSLNVNFTNYLYMSSEEIEESGKDVDYSFLNNDKKSLEGTFEFSEYYLCFISLSVYEMYNNAGEDGSLFVSLDEFSAYVTEDAYYANNAIKLSKTSFYNMPGINALPEDTLICIKTPSVLASKSKDHKEHLSRAKETLKNILIFSQNSLK